MVSRSPADSPEPGGSPISALDLVGAGGAESAPDPGAAREALDGAGDTRGSTDTISSRAENRNDRLHRPGSKRAGGRKGGHKATKTELERRVKELEAQLEQTAPEVAEQVQDAAAQLAPALGATFATGFGMLARTRGPHWLLKPDEKEMLATHWAIALAPYMKNAGPYVPWIAAAMVTWGVVEVRVNQDSSALVLPAA